MNKKHLLVACIVALAFAGCHTFTRIKPHYKDLPVDELRQVALQIEQAVAAGVREPEITPVERIPLEEDTIKQAIRTRATRAELLNEFRNSGFCWERPSGLVSVIRSSEYKKSANRRQKDRDALLVYGENQDRWTLYEGIREEGNFPPKSLSAIQRIFFEARLQCMEKGQIYEDDNGNRAYVGGEPPAKEES